MTDATAEDQTDDADDLTRTTIELDREVWRQVRAEAVQEGNTVSAELEAILRDYFGMPDMTTSSN